MIFFLLLLQSKVGNCGWDGFYKMLECSLFMRLTLCTPITGYKGLDLAVYNVVPFWCMGAVLAECPSFREHRAGSRVVRIDPLCFLTGYRKKATKSGSVCLIS